ncbi:hypothetical protein ACFL15_00625 [Patescibacteria group bacterium]
MAQKLISNSKRDKLLTKCESLLLQGVDSPTDLADSLNISFNTAKTYIRLIRERWADSTKADELQAKRQELIRKTEEIVKEAWKLRNSSKNTLEAVGALRTALMAIERLEKLQGLDSLPLPIEKSEEIQIYEYAQEISNLPKEEKSTVLEAVRNRIREVSAI